MSADKKLTEADDHLKEIDAALRHVDGRVAGAEEKLTPQVTDNNLAPPGTKQLSPRDTETQRRSEDGARAM